MGREEHPGPRSGSWAVAQGGVSQPRQRADLLSSSCSAISRCHLQGLSRGSAPVEPRRCGCEAPPVSSSCCGCRSAWQGQELETDALLSRVIWRDAVTALRAPIWLGGFMVMNELRKEKGKKCHFGSSCMEKYSTSLLQLELDLGERALQARTANLQRHCRPPALFSSPPPLFAHPALSCLPHPTPSNVPFPHGGHPAVRAPFHCSFSPMAASCCLQHRLLPALWGSPSGCGDVALRVTPKRPRCHQEVAEQRQSWQLSRATGVTPALPEDVESVSFWED